MRHQLQRFYIDCPDWRLRVDVRGLVEVERDLTTQLESVARRSSNVDDLVRGLRALADRSGLVVEIAAEPQWDGAGLELQVGFAVAA
jgi:hypothetical protein